MKISDERCFMLYCNLTAAEENDIPVYLNKQSITDALYDEVSVRYGSMLWIPLGTVCEIPTEEYSAVMKKNGEAMNGVPGRFGTMYGGFQPGDIVSIDDPPTNGKPGKEA